MNPVFSLPPTQKVGNITFLAAWASWFILKLQEAEGDVQLFTKLAEVEKVKLGHDLDLECTHECILKVFQGARVERLSAIQMAALLPSNFEMVFHRHSMIEIFCPNGEKISVDQKVHRENGEAVTRWNLSWWSSK